ncbi:MAG: ABC transporter permease [Candidatus Paceibacterota bacterium]|jgi:putative ABC transport system permease protein|nr:ABC transporter permease [Candidatus Paceibacterota bacterium]
MTTIDILEETYFSLTANKVRTALTMLGIIIGISSVIAMVSIGQGAQASIESNISSMGSDLIIVQPGAPRTQGAGVQGMRGGAKSLTQEDAAAIVKEIPLVKAVAPEISTRLQVTTKGMNTNTTVDGVTSSYPGVKNVQIDQGSFITDQNTKSFAKVAVIGPTVQTDLFAEGVSPIGKTIRIKSIEFKVIGVTKAKGGSGFGNADDMIFIPLTTAGRYFSGDQYVTTINVQAIDSNSMAEVQTEVTDLLLTRHHISDPTLADFSTMNLADLVSTVSSVTGTFTTLLAAIAAISLLVGGIGIMNMMLTTVTERTKEIGLRKSVGAKKRDINLQFLAEAVMLTFSGGVAGVALGWLIAYGISAAGILQTSISISSILLAFGVSAGIGIVFGYYPARKAGAMNPIDALRYE